MPPRFDDGPIPLAEILVDDDAFRVSTDIDKNNDLLKASIAEAGLLSPPILRKKPEGYQVVAGFRRLACLKMLGENDVAARLLPPDTDDLACLKLAILDNTGQRPLNPGEQARAISRLALFFDTSRALCEAAAGLSLPANPAVIERLQLAAALPEKVFGYFTGEVILLSIAVDLARMEADTAIRLADLFAALKLGVNKQREVLTLLEEIAAREDKTLSQVLAEEGLRQIVDDDQADRGRRAADLRVYLRQRRFPAITQKQDWFAQQVRSLKLGKRLSLLPPANFEGADFTLQMTFRDLAELQDHARRLAEVIESPAMKEILS